MPVTISTEGLTVTVDGPSVTITRDDTPAAKPRPKAAPRQDGSELPAAVKVAKPRRRGALKGSSYATGRARGKAIRAFADRTPGFSRRDYRTEAGHYYVNKRLRDAFNAAQAAQQEATR